MVPSASATGPETAARGRGRGRGRGGGRWRRTTGNRTGSDAECAWTKRSYKGRHISSTDTADTLLLQETIAEKFIRDRARLLSLSAASKMREARLVKNLGPGSGTFMSHLTDELL